MNGLKLTMLLQVIQREKEMARQRDAARVGGTDTKGQQRKSRATAGVQREGGEITRMEDVYFGDVWDEIRGGWRA